MSCHAAINAPYANLRAKADQIVVQSALLLVADMDILAVFADAQHAVGSTPGSSHADLVAMNQHMNLSPTIVKDAAISGKDGVISLKISDLLYYFQI